MSGDAASRSPLPAPPENLPALTGIRAIAAGLVVLLHLNQTIPGAGIGDALPFTHYGYLGVDIFFVLSGFILSHVYGQALARFDLRTYGRYLWFRLARLYPVHIAVLVALVGLVLLLRALGQAPNNPANWEYPALVYHVTLTHAWGFLEAATWNGPAWSISLEFLAYLLLPAFLLLTSVARHPLAAALGAALACALLAGLFLEFGWRIKDAHVGADGIVRVLTEFGAGCFLYRMWRRVPAGPWWDLAAVSLLVVSGVLTAVGVSALVLVPLLGAAVLAVAQSTGPFHRFLATRTMVWLGEISYAVYLVHFAILLVAGRALAWSGLASAGTAVSLLAALATLAAILIVAAAAYHGIERPARRWMRGLWAGRAARTSAAVGEAVPPDSGSR